jgi:hypothetical protein
VSSSGAHPGDAHGEDRGPADGARPGSRPGRLGGRRGGLAWLGLVAGLTAVLALGLVLVPFADHDAVTKAATRAQRGRASASGRLHAHRAPAQRHGQRTVVATIAPATVPRPVPRSFLGLSTEYWSLPAYESNMPVFGRVLSMLHVAGQGPLVLRVGGNSADHTFWEPAVRRLPRWMFQLTPAWLRAARTLLQRFSVRLILDLNLVTDRPLVAAQWARAAEAQLPHRSIIGFEIGNEPDIYSRWFWITRMARTGRDTGTLPRALAAADYNRDFRAYARLLSRIAPHVPLLGPALANPSRHLSWISTLIRRARDDLGIVTAHRYPYSACVSPISAAYPTIARVLSEKASAGMARSLAPAVALAHRAGLPFRLTELNSVTCHGLAGVSNTFATALWAPDALFELLRAGVGGVNVHVHTNTINAAFTLNPSGLSARPLLYGLITFRRMLGAGAALLPLHLSTPRSPHLKVWAVRVAGGRVHVLVIDKGASPVTLDVRGAGQGPATVARLLDPSVSATSNVTLAGQWLGRDGRWRGRRSTETIAPARDGYRLTVGRFSAALLTIRRSDRS